MAGIIDHVGVASCVAHTLIAATCGKNLATITEHVLPAAEAISWAPLRGSQLMVDVVSSLGAWPSMGLGASAERVISCITRAGSFGHFGAPYTSACAFRLADFFSRAATSEEIRGSHRDVANQVGLPEGPAAHTPREFLELYGRAGPVPLAQYIDSASKALFLYSRAGSAKATSSALKAWGIFCDVNHAAHFPPVDTLVASFATIFRDPGTYAQYVSHLKGVCEYLGAPTSWAWSPCVARAKLGLKKAQFVHCAPKMAIKGDLISQIAGDVRNSRAERFYCILTWVFLLRANSEATHLRRAASSAEFNVFEPLACEGVIGMAEGCLVIRLRSRKNRVGGETIVRHCVCQKAEGVSPSHNEVSLSFPFPVAVGGRAGGPGRTPFPQRHIQ